MPLMNVNTKLLLHCNGADTSTTFTDDSGTSKTATANGNAQIDTAQYKFGSASGLFDGNGDYLSLSSSADFSFDADFTIDAWVKYNSRTDTAASYYLGILSDAIFNGGSPNGWRIRKSFIDASNQVATFTAFSSGSTLVNLEGASDIADGSWHHIAVTRSGSTVRLFVDGIQEDSDTYAGTVNNDSGGLHIGKGWTDLNQDYHNGWIDEVNIVKGTALYTANFALPAEEYGTDSFMPQAAWFI